MCLLLIILILLLIFPFSEKSNIKQIRVPESSQVLFVSTAIGQKEAKIEVCQPNHCLLLMNHHIQSTKVKHVKVYLQQKLSASINGSITVQPSSVWKKAIYHICNTYRPTTCSLHTSGFNIGIMDGFKVELCDGYDVDEANKTSYKAYWNTSQTILSIIR